MANRKADIAGQRFGKLVASHRSQETSEAGNYYWVFKCDCGGTATRTPASVRASNKRGCLIACNPCRSRNEFAEKDGTVFLDVSTKTHPSAICLLDSDDLDVTLNTGGRWHAARGPNGILYVTQKNGGYLHRLLMGPAPKGMEIDHINGAGLDNRKENLREVTKSDNRRNTRVSSRNKTGVVGVHKHQGRFAVTIVNRNQEQLWVGIFSTIGQAMQARKQAEVEHGYHENHGRVA